MLYSDELHWYSNNSVTLERRSSEVVAGGGGQNIRVNYTHNATPTNQTFFIIIIIYSMMIIHIDHYFILSTLLYIASNFLFHIYL